MAKGSGVTIKGGPETARAFDQLSDDVRDLAPEYARVIAARLPGVRSRTPVATGELAASWDTSAESTGGSILSPLAHAGVHEWGSAARGITASAMVRQTLEAEAQQLADELEAGILERAEKRGFRID